MRIRNALASAAVGSALVLGGLAGPAQAAPAPVDTNTTTDGPISPLDIVIVDYYQTLPECEADGEASAYSWWDCVWYSGIRAFALLVDTDS